MGIRIHKMLGYGLTDVRTKKYYFSTETDDLCLLELNMEFRVHFIDDMTFAVYQGKKLVRIFHNLTQLEYFLDWAHTQIFERI
jgi:hypothetical protein